MGCSKSGGDIANTGGAPIDGGVPGDGAFRMLARTINLGLIKSTQQ